MISWKVARSRLQEHNPIPVGVTDGNWCELLSNQPGVDEVNLWQPGDPIHLSHLQNERIRIQEPAESMKQARMLTAKRGRVTPTPPP